jgi:hypothetical protein
MNTQEITKSRIDSFFENQGVDVRSDAIDTGFIAKSLEFVKSTVYEYKYPEFKARRLLPVSASNTGAERIAVDMVDQYGKAKIVSDYAADFPNVDVGRERDLVKVYSIGDSFAYSEQDLRASAFAGLGQPLDVLRANAARRAIEQKIEDLAAVGDTAAGIKGLYNLTNVPLISAVTGTWSTATAAQILKDFRTLVSGVVRNSKTTIVPNQVVLTFDLFDLLAGTSISSDQPNVSILDRIRTVYPGLAIDYWQYGETADAAGTGARAVAYFRDPSVVSLEIPQEFEMTPPQQKMMSFVVACHARCAGVISSFPKGIAYMDGL